MIDKAQYHPNYAGIGVDTTLSTLEETGVNPPQLSTIVEYLAASQYKVVLVDNSSAASLAEAYPTFLRRGISIIIPNKKAFSGGYELWQEIFSSARAGGSFVYHESTVGAGVPIISTLNDLVQTGDEITRIEGVFSGIMCYLFNKFAPTSGSGGKWSDIVKLAKELGFTEPDPRDGLNGLDVARKLTILGRLAGLPIESTASFPVESLIPAGLDNVASGDGLLCNLPTYGNEMEQKRLAAEKAGKVVRFVGSVDILSKEAKVGLEWFDQAHPIATLKGSDNIISFYTKRYGDMPLTIRGAGAGGQVTAMGVTSDLLKVLRQLK